MSTTSPLRRIWTSSIGFGGFPAGPVHQALARAAHSEVGSGVGRGVEHRAIALGLVALAVRVETLAQATEERLRRVVVAREHLAARASEQGAQRCRPGGLQQFPARHRGAQR